MSEYEFYALAAIVAGAAVYAMRRLNQLDDAMEAIKAEEKKQDEKMADIMSHSIDLTDMNTMSSQRSGNPAFNKHVNIVMKPRNDPLQYQRDLTRITLAQDRMRHTLHDEAESGIVLPTHAEQKWYNGSIATDQ